MPNNKKIKIGSNKSFGIVFSIFFTLIFVYLLWSTQELNKTFLSCNCFFNFRLFKF